MAIFKAYKQILEKKKKQEPPKIIRKTIKTKNPLKLHTSEFERLKFILSSKNLRKSGYRKILKEKFLLDENFKELFEILFTFLLEGDENSLLIGCIKKMCRMITCKYIGDIVFSYFKSAIIMGYMCKSLYNCFFITCSEFISDEEFVTFVDDKFKEKYLEILSRNKNKL